jgi:hypothetical protein
MVIFGGLLHLSIGYPKYIKYNNIIENWAVIGILHSFL